MTDTAKPEKRTTTLKERDALLLWALNSPVWKRHGCFSEDEIREIAERFIYERDSISSALTTSSARVAELDAEHINLAQALCEALTRIAELEAKIAARFTGETTYRVEAGKPIEIVRCTNCAELEAEVERLKTENARLRDKINRGDAPRGFGPGQGAPHD